MNTDQAVALITKLIVAACTGLAVKYGFTASELQNVAVDAATLAVGVATIIFGHYWNKAPAATANPQVTPQPKTT